MPAPLKVREIVESASLEGGYFAGTIVRIDRKTDEAEIHLEGTDPPKIRRAPLASLRRPSLRRIIEIHSITGL